MSQGNVSYQHYNLHLTRLANVLLIFQVYLHIQEDLMLGSGYLHVQSSKMTVQVHVINCECGML